MATHTHHTYGVLSDPYSFTISDVQDGSGDATTLDPSAVPNSVTTANALVYPSQGLIAGETMAQWIPAWWNLGVADTGSDKPDARYHGSVR